MTHNKKRKGTKRLSMIKGLRLTTLLLFVFLIGCASSQPQVKRRYFWPPPPETPKVEFLTAYWGSSDMPKSGRQRFIESLVGSEELMLERPWGVTSDGEGKIYVTDMNVASVVLFDIKKGNVTYMGGKELAGSFENPIGLALDAAGNIYVSDSKKKKVFVYTKDEQPLRTIGGEDILKWPVGLAINNKLGRLYVADSQGHNIKVFDLSGNYLFAIGRAGDRNGQFRYPNSVAIAPDGSIVVADTLNARVQVLDPDGKFIRKMGQRGDGPTDLQVPKGIGVTKAGHIYVTEGRGSRVVVYNMNGDILTFIGWKESSLGTGSLSPGAFLQPSGLFVDKNDTIYVADSFNSRIQVFQELSEEYLKEHPIEEKKQVEEKKQGQP